MQNESSHLRQKARHREIMERSGALMISDAPDWASTVLEQDVDVIGNDNNNINNIDK
jgi:hypothetical protein